MKDVDMHFYMHTGARIVGLATIATSLTLPARAEESTPPSLDVGMISFFAGDWSGSGEFASGKKIEADVNFHLELDGKWLMYTHTDRSPNRYKAIGMWGYDTASNQLTMTVNDNFGSARKFVSRGGNESRIIFVNATSARQERFIFEQQGIRQFKMTYETSMDGETWRLGDYLVFIKR